MKIGTINPNKLKSKTFNTTQSNHVVHKDKRKEIDKKKCRKKIKRWDN